MFNLFKNKRKNAHSMLFPMLLWFIPILVLNASIFFVSKIDAHHKEKMQREAANEELRSMSTASEFDFQFSNHAEIFWKKLVNIANFPNTQKLKKQIENALSQTFVQPFPEYDIYVFYAPDKNSSSSLIYKKTNAQNQGIKKVCMTFDYLVESDLQKKESKNNSKKAIAKKFINSSTNPEAYAKVRGIPTYSLYNSESNYFIWNYTINSNNELYGYFLFCKNDVNYEKNSKKLALNKKQREQLTPEDPLYGCLRAYVPFIGNPKSGEYSNPILKKSSNLQNVINSFLPKNLEQIYIYQQKEIPSEIEIGNYKLYTYLGKKQDFLCLLLVPSNSKFIAPSWLHAFNIIYISILILMLFRGLAFNKWPNISLKSRFTMCFALSALFPLSIFGMISYGYIIQSIDSETQNKLMDMQNSLNKFDGFREQIANECIMNFRKLSKNKELIDLIRKEGKADSKAVKDAIIDLFFNKANLPLDAICLVDQNAIGSKITVSKNYSSDNGNNNKITIGEVDNSIISTVLVPTCRALGLIKAEKKGDKYKSKLPTSNIETYYNSFEKSRAGKIGQTSLQLAQALSNNKENILNINLDNNIKSIIAFDYVEIEGIPEYVIVVKCNDDALNRIAYAQAASILNIENPNTAFTAFKKNLDGLKEVNNGQHFHLPQFSRISEKVLRRKALEIAEKVASQHKVLTSAYNKNIFFTAYPSKQLTNYVIVGVCSTETIDQEVLKKQALLLVIALIAFIIVCICNYIANRITLDPIAKIKAALDKVRDGNNNISIISNGSDEISVLCKEFSNMTKGLRERQALSTLISDQALYAIKQGMLKTDTFNGVALVTDIRNFTGISEANDPNEITGMLNMHFAEMTSIISNYGGRIYKYIGDAIEAVFTDDKNDSDVAGRAALAALSMLDKLKEINANRQKSNLFTYKIGIGLKYGTFYSGEVGSMDTRIDYAILGEPLKKAALLESFSKKNPELPIVIDEFVKEKLENSGFILEHLLTEPETKAYIIKKTPEDLKLQNIISSENHTTNNKLEIIDSNVKIGLFYSKHSYSLFFIIATIFFIFFNDCFNIVVKAKDNYLNNKTQNNINRIFEQIKNSEMTNGLFFEYACRKGISQLKKELVKGFSIKQLKPQIDYFIKNNNIDRYLIFDGENEYTENFDIKKLHIQKSNKKTKVSNLSDLLKEAMFFHSDTQKPYWKTDSTLDDLQARVFEKEVFITNVSDLDLVRKKITPTNEYIYWDFLYDINNKLPNGKNKPIGYVILLQNTNNKISFSTFAQCITYDPNIFIAIKESNSDIWNFSYDYKKETKPIILNNNTINTNDYVACSDLDQSLHFYDKTYSLIVAAKKQNSDLLTAKLSFVAVFIFLMILFGKIIRKTSFVNKSLSCKLKLILASVAFVPIIALILIYEFYSTEKLSFKQTNSLKDIQSFAQDFENKLFITTPFVLDMINDYSSKKELQKLMKSKTSKKSIEKKINNILKFDNNHIIKTENNDKKGNYDVSDIIITDKNFTFSFNYNSVKTNKANDIGKMFKEAGQGIAAITFTSDKSENELKLMANGAKVEESFELIKSFFGTEIYLKFPHYLDKLNHIEMGSKKIISCMKIIPNLKNPLYIILWALSFDINQIKEITNNYNKKQKQEKKQIKFGLIDYLKNLYNILTENYKNQYIVEALDLESYGLTDFTDYSPDFNSEVKQISSYKSNKKTTLTGLTRFDGIDIIYDVRDCAETPNYALFTINELSPFHKSIKFQRIVFYASITLIIFFVLLLTNNVTKDIIYPIELLTTGINQVKKENYSFRINLERYDELGILCHSFDNMAKGLEEKELMQKMVSKTAKNETLSNKLESSKKAECILIYVSVPDFGNYIKNISPNIVLSDLKTQVALIANAVINAGGEVDKIMAEKQLIAFHIENELVKQKIEAACSSAKSIIKLAKEGSLPFPVSIGISYGTVVTGFLGVGEKRDFTVIGDPVNVAARIATYGENQVPDCHISEDIYNLAKDKFNSELSGEISLKGKSQPMKLYKLL